MELPYAEDINYYQTSKSPSGKWMERARKIVEEMGGSVLLEARGIHPITGRPAFVFLFQHGNEQYRIVQPVLPTKSETNAKESAAEVQAATLLYHDVKARALSARIHGVSRAFFAFLLLGDGRVASDVGRGEMARIGEQILSPQMLNSGKSDEQR